MEECNVTRYEARRRCKCAWSSYHEDCWRWSDTKVFFNYSSSVSEEIYQVVSSTYVSGLFEWCTRMGRGNGSAGGSRKRSLPLPGLGGDKADSMAAPAQKQMRTDLNMDADQSLASSPESHGLWSLSSGGSSKWLQRSSNGQGLMGSPQVNYVG